MARISQPYIGVTGFRSANQIQQVLAVFPETEEWVLMAGVSANRTGPCSNRYPTDAERGTIFFPHPRVMNILHYDTNKTIDLADQMERAMEMAGEHCHGIQLNLAWPDARQLHRFKEHRPDAKVILPMNGKALRLPPANLAGTMRWGYAGFVDYVLLDPSGGTGLELDPAAILPYLDALLAQNIPDLLIGFAGGLCAESLPFLAPPLISQYWQASFDACTKVNCGPPTYDVNILAAQAYVQTAAKLLLT